MSKQVFEGLRVLDFSWVVVGPLITRYLADHGATVLRVETSTRPDVLRLYPPFKDKVAGLNRSGYFTNYNANKYGISLNLSHPKGLEVAKRLVAWADVVAESFTPGTMERLGLGYEDMRKIKLDIILISTCNQGQTGPHAKHPGFGTQLVGLAGFTHLTGWPDRCPTQPYGAYTDTVAPHLGAAALVAALDYRRRTGKGQHLDISQYEASLNFLGSLILDYTVNRRIGRRRGNRCDRAAPHGAYRCRGEDRWCAIAVFTDEEWQAFCRVIGDPLWTKDERFSTLQRRLGNASELDRLVEEWTAQYPPGEVMERMQRAGIAAGVVESAEDIHQDPQLRHRRHLWPLEHREMGEHKYDTLSFTLSKTPARMRSAAPCVGEHNEYVYTQILGMSKEEFTRLAEEGVFD